MTQTATATATAGTTTYADDTTPWVVTVEPADRFGCRSIVVTHDGNIIGDIMAMAADKAEAFAARHQAARASH